MDNFAALYHSMGSYAARKTGRLDSVAWPFTGRLRSQPDVIAPASSQGRKGPRG